MKHRYATVCDERDPAEGAINYRHTDNTRSDNVIECSEGVDDNGNNREKYM